MKATITIDLDNDDAEGYARMATKHPKAVRVYLNRCSIADSGAILDTNGNRIGSVEITNE